MHGFVFETRHCMILVFGKINPSMHVLALFEYPTKLHIYLIFSTVKCCVDTYKGQKTNYARFYKLYYKVYWYI